MSPYLRFAAVLLMLAALPAFAYRPVYQDTAKKERAYTVKMNLKERITRSEGDPTYADLVVKCMATERVLEAREEKAALALDFADLTWDYFDTGRLKESRKLPAFRFDFERRPNGSTTNTRIEGETYKQLQTTEGMFDLLLISQIGMHIPFPPEREIDAGDSWGLKGTLSIANVGTLAFTTTYKCIGLTTLNGKQYLQVDATTTSDRQELHTSLQNDGVNVKLDIAIKFGGTQSTLFDLEAGEIFRSIAKHDSQIVNVLTGPDGDTLTLSAINKIDGTIRKSNTVATAANGG